MKNIIKINSPNLIFRDYVNDLEERSKDADKNGTLLLDFSNVKFISRSFADELLSFIEKHKNSYAKIQFINLKPEIEKFISIIKKRREKIKEEIKERKK